MTAKLLRSIQKDSQSQQSYEKCKLKPQLQTTKHLPEWIKYKRYRQEYGANNGYTADGAADWYLLKTVGQDLPEFELKHIHSHSNIAPGYILNRIYVQGQQKA